jgi:hypothetical protein
MNLNKKESKEILKRLFDRATELYHRAMTVVCVAFGVLPLQRSE